MGRLTTSIVVLLSLKIAAAPIFGTGTINTNDFSIAGLLVSFVVAVPFLAIVNMFRRGSVLKRRPIWRSLCPVKPPAYSPSMD